MEIALYHKFAQHEKLKQALLHTGDAELIHYTRNSFWGVGKDQKGRNEQGQALERVRSSLQETLQPGTTCVSWPQHGYPPDYRVMQISAMGASRQRIFIHSRDKQQYHGFGNRTAFPVEYNGKKYRSSEHLFQAFKYMDNRPDIAENIRTISKSPIKAFKYSMKNIAHQHPDWDRMCIAKVRLCRRLSFTHQTLPRAIIQMEIALYHKFAQNEELRRTLLRTGNAELIVRTLHLFCVPTIELKSGQHYTKNDFWGIGKDQKGRNEQGRALERVRSSLQEACPRRK
ncbi:hypothetical protein B0H17DRAFT_1095972, partial [Mycena rosella]